MAQNASRGADSGRAPDASMELLTGILRESVEPGYRQAAGHGSGARSPVAVLIVCLLAGVLLASSGISTRHGVPAAQSERAALITRIEQAQATQQEQRRQLDNLRSEVATLQSSLSVDPAQQSELNQLASVSGASAVSGPGVSLTVHDAVREDVAGRIIDQDLREVVNGLWQAGAEAIAVNGYRITSHTAIREAGSAITVNYHSIESPYRIEAIGNPTTLPGNFGQTAGASWLNGLKQNYGVSWDLSTARTLTLSGDSGLDVRQAEPVP